MENKSKSNKRESADQRRDVLYQVSLLQSMSNGDYRGSVTVKELKRHGDVGIGTFDGLNGELIMLDGEVYRAAGDGNVEVVSEDETSPFSVVTYMDADVSEKLEEIPDYDSLEKKLELLIREKGKNRFYMIRIDGMFRQMNVRSVPKQAEPYKRLVEVLEQQQTFFDYENIEGTVVGIYCPPYMSYLNAVGWHMHFISKDKTNGGHVLGVSISDAVLTWDDTDSFELRLPQNEEFDRFDLTVDQSKDIEKVEKNK